MLKQLFEKEFALGEKSIFVSVQAIVEQWNAVTQTSGPVQTLVMHWNMFMQSSWAWFVGGRLGLRRELGV